MRRTIRAISIVLILVCGSLIGCESVAVIAESRAEPRDRSVPGESSESPTPPGAEAGGSTTVSALHELRGYASWYGGKFQGRLTANGERFDTNLLTAAHKTLPFDTIVEVTHLENGKSVEVRINDRGPFVEGRVIDLSRAAAEAIDMTAQGIAVVEVRIIGRIEPRFVLQVGSFSERGNARAIRNGLVESGVNAEIERADDVHRVVVKDVPESELDEKKERLAELGYDSILVRRQRAER